MNKGIHAMAAIKIDFSKTDLATLPLPEHRAESDAQGRINFSDSGDNAPKGLRLVAQPTGHKSFELYRKIQGTPTRIIVGVFDPAKKKSEEIPKGVEPLSLVGNSPALNVRMARAIAAALNVELDQGHNPAAVKKAARQKAEGELTLQRAWDLYFTEHLEAKGKRRNAKTRDDFDRYLGYVAPGQKKLHGKEKQKAAGAVDWSKRKLSSITRGELARAMANIKTGAAERGRGDGGATANKAFSILEAVYNFVIAREYYDGDNPCKGYKKFKVSARREYVKGEAMSLFFFTLDRYEQAGHTDFTDYVRLSLFTAARQGAVLSMRWVDIDFMSGLWIVPGEKSKNGDALTIPITDATRAVLDRRREVQRANTASPWVFPADSASGHMSPPKKRWAQFIQDAGVENLTMHGLRHSAASWMVQAGVSLHITGAALGHRNASTTQQYAHLAIDPVRMAMERSQAEMMKAAVKEKAND